MLGLALEGGGAKGAFHIGAIRALLEYDYVFDGVVGTSIGAFNAALLTQGSFEQAYNLWINMEPSTLFDIEDEHMRRLANSEVTKETIKYLSGKARSLIGNRGIDTSKLRSVLDEMIDEERLRESQVDFGMVTVSVPDFKPVEIYKADIPEGMIKDYIMASSSFPGFKIDPIDGKYYIDGGIHDNCPINLLIRKGYQEVIAIRTSTNSNFPKLKNSSANITNIIPSEELGNTLIFDNNLLRRNIEMGYYDALRMIRQLKGRTYYIEKVDEKRVFDFINTIPSELILRIGATLKVTQMDPKRMMFERIIPTLVRLLKLPYTATYQDVLLGLLEVVAKQRGIEKYKVYTLDIFIATIEMASPIEDIERRKRRHLVDLKKIAIGILEGNRLDELANVILDVVVGSKFTED